VSLIAIAAIGGLGYLGHSIRESINTLTGGMDDPEAKRRQQIAQMRDQIYQTTLAELTNNNVANVAADAYVPE
jgi:hypothetical protein